MQHKGWNSRNYLPHFDSQDAIQFVTFRLADSLPKEALERLKIADKPETLRHEMLDRGWGACWLKRQPIARLVEDAFLAFDSQRYARDRPMPSSGVPVRSGNRILGSLHQKRDALAATESYIDQNPVKAGLVTEARLWPYGSARLKL